MIPIRIASPDREKACRILREDRRIDVVDQGIEGLGESRQVARAFAGGLKIQ
ncbi:MAG: hypothetical protein ACOYMN_03320 [Roseimicrobium sp.]|jgi:hypothetical protein